MLQVPCKNASHRQIVHQLAEVFGLVHETATENNQFRKRLTTYAKQQIEHHKKKMDQSPEYHTRQIRELYKSEKEKIHVQSVVLSHKARQNSKKRVQNCHCIHQKEESKEKVI